MSKGLNAATLERVRSFLAANRGRAFHQRGGRRTGAPLPHHHPAVCELYGGDWGAGQLHRLSDRRPPLHPLQLHRTGAGAVTVLCTKQTKATCKICAYIQRLGRVLSLTVQVCRSGRGLFSVFGRMIQEVSGYFTYKSHSIGTKIDFAFGEDYTFAQRYGPEGPGSANGWETVRGTIPLCCSGWYQNYVQIAGRTRRPVERKCMLYVGDLL